MNYDVVGIGNPLVDILIKTDESFIKRHGLIKGGMRLVSNDKLGQILAESTEKKMASGGSTANILNALARLDISCCLIGRIGNDEMGRFFTTHIKNNGVSSGLIIGEGATGMVVSLITKDLDRTFATYLGVAQEITTEDLKSRESAFQHSKIVHIEGYLVSNREVVSSAMEMAKRSGARISFDMASFNVVEENRDFFHELIDKYVDILFANEEEARAFIAKGPEDALDEISSMVEIAVVKMGERGSLVKRGNEFHQIGAIKVDPKDTTGAGDLYAAGFLYKLINGRPLVEAANAGALLAAKVVEVVGATLPKEVFSYFS